MEVLCRSEAPTRMKGNSRDEPTRKLGGGTRRRAAHRQPCMSRDPETVSQSWRKMITDTETGAAGRGQIAESSTVLAGSILISLCGFTHRMLRKALTAVSFSEGEKC